MVLIERKSGAFFMVLAVVLITFFLISLTSFSVLRDRSSVQKRVETLNNFVFAVEKDLERRLFISGFRTLFIFETEIIETGSSIANLDAAFEEVFFNGTLYGQSQGLMIGATFYDAEAALRVRANKIGANLSFVNPSVSISQEDPWHVKVALTMDFVLEDLSGLATWNRTYTAEAFVPLENFGDPLYVLGTDSFVFVNITRTPYLDFVNNSDVSNLLAHTVGHYYIASSDAPSFLNRLRGNFAADEHGIESLVNLNELAAAGIPLADKSVVDHIYFSSSNPTSCPVLPAGMPYWFKLDAAHYGDYEVSPDPTC